MIPLEIKQLGRRKFLLQSFVTLGTTRLLSACKSHSSSTQNSTNSGFGEKPLSLQFLNVPPANGQAPKGVIVCLHGFGANSQDLASFSSFLNLPNYQFLFPNAPFPYPNLPGGRMWYNLMKEDYQGYLSSRQKLLEWLNSLESRTGVPLSRTILCGFSQGGGMTLDVGLTLPLAGLVALSTYLTPNELPSNGESFPPVLMVHGTQDMVAPLDAARQAKDRMIELGVDLQYKEFDVGHQVSPEILTLMRNFIVEVMSQS